MSADQDIDMKKNTAVIDRRYNPFFTPSSFEGDICRTPGGVGALIKPQAYNPNLNSASQSSAPPGKVLWLLNDRPKSLVFARPFGFPVLGHEFSEMPSPGSSRYHLRKEKIRSRPCCPVALEG